MSGAGWITVGPQVIRPGPVKPLGLTGDPAFRTKVLLGICTDSPNCHQIDNHLGPCSGEGNSMRQEVIFVSEWKKNSAIPKASPIKFPSDSLGATNCPTRIWTAFRNVDPGVPPQLPFAPHHGVNAFLEDKVHDWQWRNGVLHYYSRVADRPVWLLIEF